MNLLGSKSTLSIDFGADEIKVVEGKFSKKGVVISNSLSIPVPKDLYIDGEIQDMDQFSYLLRNGLLQHKISQGDAYGVLNSSKVIMREITMPKVGENQIESILKYQLEDYLPINPEAYVVNHITLGSIMDEGIEMLNILLVGVPRIIVESHLNLFKNANLKPSVLDYSGNVINKLIYVGENINNFYDNQSTIACIDLGYDSTGLTITHQGAIKVSRIIEVGTKNMLKDLQLRLDGISEEDILNKIYDIEDINKDFFPNSEKEILVQGIRSYFNDMLDRIEMIFRYYKTREIGNDIGLILLHGGMSNIKGIDKFFNNYYDKPCVKLSSLSKVKFNGDLSKYANAIGGLIRLGEV